MAQIIYRTGRLAYLAKAADRRSPFPLVFAFPIQLLLPSAYQ